MQQLTVLNSFEKVFNDFYDLDINAVVVNGEVVRVEDLGVSIWTTTVVEAIIVYGLNSLTYYSGDKLYQFDNGFNLLEEA